MCRDYVSIISKLKNQTSIGIYSIAALLAIIFLMSFDLKAQYYNENNSDIEIISKGSNTASIKGDGFSLTSYRIEFIRPFQASDSEKSKGDKFTRIVLTGEFPGGAFVIWINGVGYYATTGTTKELHLIIAKTENILEENPEIAVSNNGLNEPRIYLPETMNVPKQILISGKNSRNTFNNVEFSYVFCGGFLVSETPTKCILVSVKELPPISSENTRNNAWYLRIGDKQFLGNYGSCVIDSKSFEELKNGEWIVVKLGDGITGGISVGRLDKSNFKTSR